ncbi:MAG: helix-turn-helix domain-containing protein [Alphaproteobacteria bacterium]
MARPLPTNRLTDLVDVAAEVFIAHGYRRTQMEMVAEALGIAKGSLYAYVESKDALFEAALLYADRLEQLPGPAALPLSAPPMGTTIATIKRRLAEEADGLELVAALSRPCPRNPRAEFSAIVADLYVRLARNRRGIKILDRSALDQSELAAAWFGEGRQTHLAALSRYLETRSTQGCLRVLPNTAVAARVVLETIVFWAVHRHWDPAPQAVREDEIPAVLTDLLLNGLEKECS